MKKVIKKMWLLSFVFCLFSYNPEGKGVCKKQCMVVPVFLGSNQDDSNQENSEDYLSLMPIGNFIIKQ